MTDNAYVKKILDILDFFIFIHFHIMNYYPYLVKHIAVPTSKSGLEIWDLRSINTIVVKYLYGGFDGGTQ